MPSQSLPLCWQDANTYQTGPLTVDKSGNIYYNVIQIFDGGSFYSFDATDSFLVKVTPQGVASMVSYKALTAADATENTTGDCWTRSRSSNYLGHQAPPRVP